MNFFCTATRFVKCDKCNHFFAIVPETETKSSKENSSDRHGNERKPPPPPRKVGDVQMMCRKPRLMSSYGDHSNCEKTFSEVRR